MKNVITTLGGANNSLDYLTRINMEELALHGDPALKINPHPKPDYVIEDPQVKINPAFISVEKTILYWKPKLITSGKQIPIQYFLT